MVVNNIDFMQIKNSLFFCNYYKRDKKFEVDMHYIVSAIIKNIICITICHKVKRCILTINFWEDVLL